MTPNAEQWKWLINVVRQAVATARNAPHVRVASVAAAAAKAIRKARNATARHLRLVRRKYKSKLYWEAPERALFTVSGKNDLSWSITSDIYDPNRRSHSWCHQ